MPDTIHPPEQLKLIKENTENAGDLTVHSSKYVSGYAIAERMDDGRATLASKLFTDKEAFMNELLAMENINARIFFPLHVHIGPAGYGTLRPVTKREL